MSEATKSAALCSFARGYAGVSGGCYLQPPSLQTLLKFLFAVSVHTCLKSHAKKLQLT